ncbi:MAG TPA: PhnD/SsuA/transferrin family substrate-binding protein [Vicinamibacteria bacterium]|nr:PhnD/SsuA/transferrin family substrate-binding protein [Vicinamibacteria bacterium]
MSLRRGSILGAWVIASVASVAHAEKKAMVVHLPEAPIESMSRLAEGVTALGTYLQGAVPELTLEVKAFRKSDDAIQFLAAQGEATALVVCDAAFLLELPEGYEAAHRFVRRGRETAKKLVVVKKDSGLHTLASLKGRSLTTTLGTTEPVMRFLAESVFRSEIDPRRWFSGIARETDDFTAIAAVLYGRTDAALVSEDNPLLASHLDKELSSVYTSPPVSLPVLAVHEGVFGPAQLEALAAAVDGLASRTEAESIRSVLSIDGFRLVPEGSRRAADLLGSASVRRELEVALPAMPLPPLPVELQALPAGAVPFVVGVELSEVAIPPELVDSKLPTQSEPAAAGKKSGREP